MPKRRAKFGETKKRNGKMRHKGNISEDKLERDAKIRQLFIQIKREQTCATIGEICQRIANMSMERFYLSEERARRMYMEWKKTGVVSKQGRYAREMRLEFVTLCLNLEKGGTTCVSNIVRTVLELPARHMGLSPNRIQRILKEQKLI